MHQNEWFPCDIVQVYVFSALLQTHGYTSSSMRRLSKSSHEILSNQTSYCGPSHWWHKTSDDCQGSHFDVLFRRSTFKEFSDKYGKDPRFKQVLKRKDQELFFTQFISTLKKRDKENRMRLRKMRWVFADRDVKSPNYCELISCDCLSQRIRCDTICPYVWSNAKGSVAVCFSILTFKQRNKYRTSWVWAAVW